MNEEERKAFAKEIAGAVVEGMKPLFEQRKQEPEKPPEKPEEEVNDDPKGELKERLEVWRSSGYIVKTLETSLEGDAEEARQHFDIFDGNVNLTC